MIFDDRLMKRGPLIQFYHTAYSDIPWGEDNMGALDNGWILKADTIQELAEKINQHPENRKLMTPEALERTVNKYNQSCELGYDKEFDRESSTLGSVEKPPFYALPLYAGGPNTKGGIKANAKRQVLNWRGEPIPRLYAAGEIASAFKYAYQAGGNLAECIVFGRIAGIEASSESRI